MFSNKYIIIRPLGDIEILSESSTPGTMRDDETWAALKLSYDEDLKLSVKLVDSRGSIKFLGFEND